MPGHEYVYVGERSYLSRTSQSKRTRIKHRNTHNRIEFSEYEAIRKNTDMEVVPKIQEDSKPHKKVGAEINKFLNPQGHTQNLVISLFTHPHRPDRRET